MYVQFVYKLYFWTSPFHEFQSLVTITEMILQHSGSPFSTVHFCEFTFSYLVHYWSSFSQWALLHLNCVSTSIIVPWAFLGIFQELWWLFHRLQCSAMDDQLLHCIRVSPKLVMHFFRVLLTLFGDWEVIGWSSSSGEFVCQLDTKLSQIYKEQPMWATCFSSHTGRLSHMLSPLSVQFRCVINFIAAAAWFWWTWLFESYVH